MSDLEKQFSELESFGDLLELCAGDPAIFKQYGLYKDRLLHEEGIKLAAVREAREEVVSNMLAEGFSVEEIEKLTKIPREKIELLAVE